MKKNIISVLTCCLLFTFSGCNKFLELESLEKVSADQLLSSEGGLNTLLASMYNAMPIEDFVYRPNQGFNLHSSMGVDRMIMSSFYTDESTRSDGDQGIGHWDFDYWPYEHIREVNKFFENIEAAKNGGTITDAEYSHLKSEAHFVRAYIYFGLAKRFGGVPLIDKVLDNDYIPGSANEALYIPRSTEKQTWEFVLKECDLAIENLPTEPAGYRASKWAAYGLKSRAALHAASLAKYWNRAPLAGDAVNQKLVGMDPADADFFYNECLSASKAIIENSGKSLYMPNPSSPEEAAKNFQELFLNKHDEIIFSKAYLDGMVVNYQGHSYDVYYSPSQGNPGFNKFGRFNPTLDIVDLFEDYTDDGTGKSAKIVTRTDGKEDFTVADPRDLDLSIPFKKYDNLYEPFKGKDARLLASVIVPGAQFKTNTIVIQGGMIKADGTPLVYADGNDVGKDGKRYYAFGAEGSAGFSGFFGMGRKDDANFTSTGFTVRKYLQEGKTLVGRENSSTTSWIDMRLAEIYLNYAEAAVESGKGDMALAANLINALRRRAGHTDNIPATLANILKERQVELAFEGFRYWDLVRRREYHTVFSSGRRKALVPLIDLREEQPKYIFVRANFYYDEYAGGRTFQTYRYYKSIPGRNTNNLVENPQY
ncbi:RagB/SusD family nutrient uptake outer membrane protein [Parabacteroides sp. PF5-9]|uniref:RagB/SusD family nutrient uptake outer membrane protein n=1 Tax=Parabacteroides sp. PF5-9 TaxID=1742404 RepID=UPI0024770014|nr:RagB/SusD family nutrient uptake outer membrane protein [Parabacteroides sp. PF5-9]MDH6356213.1 hypothetical protein [Parabacteroides sp. PF5-9]